MPTGPEGPSRRSTSGSAPNTTGPSSRSPPQSLTSAACKSPRAARVPRAPRSGRSRTTRARTAGALAEQRRRASPPRSTRRSAARSPRSGPCPSSARERAGGRSTSGAVIAWIVRARPEQSSWTLSVRPVVAINNHETRPVYRPNSLVMSSSRVIPKCSAMSARIAESVPTRSGS